MTGILFWIVPPLVGALIGYVTNAIAIKMLFRPLKEIRLFNLRLPFTPGILPRERGKLADSIGRMVEQELLTPGVLRERLAKPEVQEKLENALGEYTEQVLERPLAYWLEEKNSDVSLTELLKDFFNSEVFDSFLEEIIKNWIWGSSAAEEAEDSFGRKVKDLFRNFGGVFVPAARGFIKNGIEKDIKNHSLGKPSLYRKALESIIEKYPKLLTREFLSLGKTKKQKVDSFLTVKATDTLDDNIERALASVNVKVLVSDRINSLDMLRVEKIVLDVMAGQLRWINFFGAILGALIGFIQILLSFLH